jgi:Skp family chaperone for outer membrane proteins
MSRIHKLTAATAHTLTLLGGTLADRAYAQPAPAPTPTHLACINIVKVFAGIDEKKDGDREIEDMGNKINADRKTKENNLKALRDGLESGTFNKNSPDYKRQQDEALQAAMDLQVFLSVSEQRLLLMQRMKTEQIYRSINEAVKKYAEAHGIALVFVTDDPDFSAAKDVRELTSRIAMRKIIYAHPDYDITAKIIEAMNSTYKGPNR